MAYSSITNWAEEDRPREKLRDLGPEALSKTELLAILIGSGNPGESAVDLMQRILHDVSDNLNSLGKLTIRDLMQYKGIGEAKAITILAACELGKRRQKEDVPERPKLDTARKVYEYMHPRMQDLDTEEGWVLLLNQDFKLIRSVKLSHGGLSETSIDVRIVLKEALLANSTIITLCHNHPSGSLHPSREDEMLTRNIHEACRIMRIYLSDHVIITDGDYYSFHENGKI